MIEVPLASIDGAFKGVVPSAVASCGADGIPNVSYLSVVLRVDDERIALSNQYMGKTAANLRANPRAAVRVFDPGTMEEYDLTVRFVHSLSSGDTFERLRAQLEASAAQAGMGMAPRLKQAEILHVESCRRASGEATEIPEPVSDSTLDGVAVFVRRLAETRDLAEATRVALEAMEDVFDITRSMVLVADEAESRLFVVAANGYDEPGAGAEVDFGTGAIGVAAHRRRQVRVANTERSRRLAGAVDPAMARREIPLPGAADAESLLATPMVLHNRLLGVLHVDSPIAGAFDENAARLLEVLAGYLAVTVALHESGGLDPGRGSSALVARRSSVSRTVSFHESDGTVLVDGEYVIKGVPGRILHWMLSEHQTSGRTAFSNKEIRLSRSIGLPYGNDNLEARLLTLRRRLAERDDPFLLERTGRGRLELSVGGPFSLETHPDQVI